MNEHLLSTASDEYARLSSERGERRDIDETRARHASDRSIPTGPSTYYGFTQEQITAAFARLRANQP